MKTESNNILIVEDEIVVSHFIRDWLIHFGYRVSGIAVDYESALALNDRDTIDLVLMDIHIRGERDGIVTARKLGKPVVYITAYDDDRHLSRALESNPLGYLLKPFDERDLKILVNLAFDKIRKGKKSKGKKRTTNLSAVNPSQIEKEITRLLEKEKIFKTADLTPATLAANLNISTHQLSEIINTCMKTTYSRLIRDYRIEEAKKLLLENPHEKILQIAYDAGFHSKTTFNNAFKEYTGISPQEYRKKHG